MAFGTLQDFTYGYAARLSGLEVWEALALDAECVIKLLLKVRMQVQPVCNCSL